MTAHDQKPIGTLRVGGREFVPVGSTTLRHDLATQRELHRAGLEGMKLEPGETAQQFALRLMRKACVKGDLPALLGCLLMPADAAKWTPQVAAETADFLGELEAPEDKRIVQSQINSVLFSFMTAGLLSLVHSATSSPTAANAQGRPNGTEPSQSTEAGQNSSSPLQVTT